MRLLIANSDCESIERGIVKKWTDRQKHVCFLMKEVKILWIQFDTLDLVA